MSLPTAPSHRFAYDDDGSVVFKCASDGSSLTEFSAADAAKLNSEVEQDIEIIDGGYVGVVFPEKREIDGIFVSMCADDFYPTTPGSVETSVDTTTGADGTWTQQIADIDDLSIGYWRSNITSLAVSGVKGIRVHWNNSVRYDCGPMHIYGSFTPGETPDRLLFLDPANSDAEFSNLIDYGDIAQGATTTKQVKIKNNSATYSFTSVQVTAEDLAGAYGDYVTFCETIDGTYVATIDIGTLAPGASKLLYMKQLIPDAGAIGPWAARVQVSFGTMV